MKSFPDLDFDLFHRRELPQRLQAGNGKLAAADLRGVPPLAFRLDDGRAYTYTPAEETIDIVAGLDGAETVVEPSLSSRRWYLPPTTSLPTY